MRRVVILSLLCLTGIGLYAPDSRAQGWGRVSGTVRDASTGERLPGVSVIVYGTNYGTAANGRGHYSLRVPEGRYLLAFSFVGYAPTSDSVRVSAEHETVLDIVLSQGLMELEGITVEAPAEAQAAGVVRIDPEDVQRIPAPFKDGFRILKLQPGVATNNELSSDYSVRGGGFNENLVFIDGFEVYRPFRVRHGEQEGLGIINPELTRRMTLHTGGFPARYGGKLSSALDVEYLEPHRSGNSVSAYASLLDAGTTVNAATADRRAGIGLAFRAARARRFFQTQELKGQYDPRYADVQSVAHWEWAGGQEIRIIGSYAHQRFRLEPSTRKTFFGTFNNLQSLWVNYDGREIDGYETAFAGVLLGNEIGDRAQSEHRYAYFETDEREDFDVAGSAVLYVVENPFGSDPGTGEGLFPVGTSRQEDYADNRVRIRTHALSGRYRLLVRRQAAEAGWMVRSAHFDDTINEKSIVEGTTAEGMPARVVADSLFDHAAFSAWQHSAYVQHEVDLLPETNRLVVTAGLRADHFSFNGEWTWSPRVSLSYRLSGRTRSFASWGVFHQAPSYRELRGSPEPGSGILGALNRNLESQQSVHYVAGLEHFVPSRRMTVRAEAYFKSLSNLISYEVQNVRVLYSGENDAEGFASGFDVQFRGELVPGLESWLNYGFLVTRERFLEAFLTQYNRGSLPRPTDQRHTFSILVQDYVPRDPTWKISLRLLYGTGLPYTPPAPGPQIGSVRIQVPGPRSSARYPSYKRVDLGATKTIELLRSRASGRTLKLALTGEVLNVFDMTNTVAYTWVIGSGGIWSRIPTRLTPRTYNLRARMVF